MGWILTSCRDLCVQFPGMYTFSGALMSVPPPFSVCFWLLFASSWYFILSYVPLLFLLDIKPSG